MPTKLSLIIDPAGETRTVQVHDLVIAGWTGRDVEALEKHIRELEEVGVPRPSSVPCFYRAGAEMLTTSDRLQFLGDSSSGEVEFVLIGTEDGMLIGVGSDHTDREPIRYRYRNRCARNPYRRRSGGMPMSRIISTTLSFAPGRQRTARKSSTRRGR